VASELIFENQGHLNWVSGEGGGVWQKREKKTICPVGVPSGDCGLRKRDEKWEIIGGGDLLFGEKKRAPVRRSYGKTG